jgi:hypothetical protein
VGDTVSLACTGGAVGYEADAASISLIPLP